jgi:hypothetical protein
MSGLRFFRLFCLSLLGGFLAAVVIVALVRRWRGATVARMPERPRQRIVLAEVVP